MNSPKLIGITGGIGSGKSTVCSIFEVLGVPVYYADDRGKFLLTNDQEIVKKVKTAFGESSYTDDGELNRSYLSELVFSNPEQLEKLNGLVHPAVGVDFKKWVKVNNKHPYILKEAALLFETSSYETLDKIICVFAPKKVRIERVLLRDTQRSLEQVERIIGQQTNDETRRKLSTYKIQNDTKSLLIPQVMKIHEALS